MTEKVKLTQSQVNAIDWIASETGRDHEDIIRDHADKPGGWMHGAGALNDMPLLTLVDALRIGYEVELEYKKDDWVQDHHGNIGVVTKVEGDKVWGSWNGVKHEAYARRREIVKKFTSEEIRAEKESRVWAGIGRKAKEFQYGDVLINKMNVPFTVGGFDQTSDGFINTKTAERWYRDGGVKGIYPAGSFVSFEEGDEE